MFGFEVIAAAATASVIEARMAKNLWPGVHLCGATTGITTCRCEYCASTHAKKECPNCGAPKDTSWHQKY